MISVTKWLALSEVHQDQERFTAVRRPYPGSCGWVFKDATMNTWLGSSQWKHSGLWINGIPGAGMQASAMPGHDWLKLIKIQGRRYLHPQSLNDRKRTKKHVFAFLLQTWRSSRNSFHSIGRTLLVQLMHQNDGLLPCIYERQVTGYEMTPGTSATLKDLLKVGMGDSRKMYVIIDGLDECEKSERSKVLAWLGSVTTADGDPTIKMAAFSTDEPDIKRKLSKFLEKGSKREISKKTSRFI